MTQITAQGISLKRLVFGILLCLALSILLFASQAFFGAERAYGAQIEVTSSDDSGEGTLRQAILSAGMADTEIVFNFSSDTTITLKSALINMKKSFTIRNGGTGSVAIVAAPDAPVIWLEGGSVVVSGCTLVGNGTSQVILANDDQSAPTTNLTLGGDNASDAITVTGGGDSGIKFLGVGTLKLADNVLISNNSSTTQGGGIYLFQGSLLVAGSAVIQNNTAPQGADIYFLKNDSIGLGRVGVYSKIVIGSVYTAATPSTTRPYFRLDGWLTRDSSIRVEPFAAVPYVGSTLVSSENNGILKTDNPASFIFDDLGSGSWAQVAGDNSSSFPNMTKIIVSDAPSVTCTNIDLNNIQPLVLTFSRKLPKDSAPYLLYPYVVPSNLMGPEIHIENPPGADNGFVYSLDAGTVTLSATFVKQYIDTALSVYEVDPLGSYRMEIIVEGSSNSLSYFYADFTITRGSSPGPSPLPATSDAAGLVLPLVCFFTGLLMWGASFRIRSYRKDLH